MGSLYRHGRTWWAKYSVDGRLVRESTGVEIGEGITAPTQARDFLKVRLRDVCPRCGAKVRKAGVRGMDAYFCPHCQPATRSGLVDWTKTGK